MPSPETAAQSASSLWDSLLHLEPSFDGVATLVSVGVAVLALWIGFIQNQLIKKEQITLQIMLELLTCDKFSNANVHIMSYAENDRTVDPRHIDPNEDNLFMSLLSMYEFISIAFLTKKMDRKIILRQRRSGLARTYSVLRDYMDYKRAVWKRPHAYRSFETLVTKYINPEYQRLVQDDLRVQEQFAAAHGHKQAIAAPAIIAAPSVKAAEPPTVKPPEGRSNP